jgi:peptidyl-prolyl cis-trans isomerase C
VRTNIFLISIISFILIISGCGRRDGKVLAKIDGRVITREEFNRNIERLPMHYQEIIKKEKKKFLDDLIMEELLHREAINSNIEKEPEAQEVLAQAKRKILVSRLIKERVDDKIDVSEENVKRHYDEHSEEFLLPERWRASHIVIDTREEAQEIKEILNQGASFEELAGERSRDTTSKKGGDVGYFSKGQLIPEFENACFALEVGEVSDIVKTKFGYHVIKLTDRKSPEVQEFSSVSELIKKELAREQKKELLEQLTDGLKSKAKITVNEELLEEIVGEAEEPVEGE